MEDTRYLETAPMAIVELTDSEIHALTVEQKVFPVNYSRRFQLKPRRGHSEAQIDIDGSPEHTFRFILRQSLFNSLDFSAILGYHLPGKLFLLRRYNGKSHEHTNNLEREAPFYNFHIHQATERYQAGGFNEEKYAVQTDRYATLRQAFDCLIEDCGVVLPNNDAKGQASLFSLL